LFEVNTAFAYSSQACVTCCTARLPCLSLLKPWHSSREKHGAIVHALHAHSMESHTPTPAQGQNCAHLPNHVIISLAGTAYTAVYPIAQSGDLTAALASDQASLPLDLAHARALQELKERCWLSILKWRKVGTRVMVQVSVRSHTRAHTLHMNLFSTPFHIKPDEQRSHRHDGLQPHQCKEAV